jgi:hypothetical protein
MNTSRFVPSLDRDSWLRVSGAAAAIAVAIALYTRYNIDGTLTRDEGIYTYGGQRLAHGIAPYDSIVDPKGPLATMLCGLGAAVARLFGSDDVLVIRALYCALSVLTVLMIYVLVTRLFKSVVGGVAAAVVFVAFEGYARAALVGPDAKVPGLLAGVIAMWLVARRQWLWAGVAAGFTLLDWQPLLAFPAFVVLAALIGAVPEERWRATLLSVGGVAAPVLLSIIYFGASGALGRYYESALEFPLTGVHRTHETVGHRIHRIVKIVHKYYGFSGVLFWIGLVLLLVAGVALVLRERWPANRTDALLTVVIPTGLFELAYAATDFQNYPDLYPLLLYPAIGFGAAVALAGQAVRQPRLLQAGSAAVLAGALALTALSWSWFTDSRANNTGLLVQRAYGCALNRIVPSGTTLYSLGNPDVLVVTHRTNPDRFIFLNSGVDAWKVKHTNGGFAGWVAQIQASNPSVLVVDGWSGKYRKQMRDALTSLGYQRGYLGQWRVFVTREVRSALPGDGISITQAPTKWPQTDAGTKFTATSGCRVS